MPNKRRRESSQEKVNRCLRKIKQLEDKERRKRRRIFIESCSDSDLEQNNKTDNDVATDPQSVLVQHELSAVAEDAAESSTDIAADGLGLNSADVEATHPVEELDPELLLALGEETGNLPSFGEKIHQSLAQRWEPILKKGLLKEVKDKLLKDYLVPENCTLLQAQKLNVEIAAAISEASRSRDKRKQNGQQQLGIGIPAINKAISLLLTSDNKIEAIKFLGDGCRILNDLHYQDTQSRIDVINYSLAKPFLSVVQDSERDETLYGNKLPEKIKASKAIERQGLQIRKYTKQKPFPSTEQPSISTSPQAQNNQASTYQTNWSGPSRFYQDRGGRRGSRTTATPLSRRPPPPPPPPHAESSAATLRYKPRAPHRQ